MGTQTYGSVYVSDVSPKTEKILRMFAAKNDLALREVLDMIAHLVCGYSTSKLFQRPLGGEYDPQFAKLDSALREHMATNYPEWYTERSILRRLFGSLFQPLNSKDLRIIDAELEAERAK